MVGRDVAEVGGGSWKFPLRGKFLYSTPGQGMYVWTRFTQLSPWSQG